MKFGYVSFISVAACITSIVLMVFGWSQTQNHDSGQTQSIDSWSAADASTKPILDTPIQPILPPNNLNQEKVVLGQLLFNEPRLSSTDSISCASCHDLNRGGADGLVSSVGVNGGIGDNNSPTVFNAALNIAQFWDGRAITLEEQIDGPIHNPKELGTNWPQIIAKLKSDSSYQSQFNKIYSDGITTFNIKNAISTFARSLLTTNSPFDRYLQGDSDAIDENAKKGYELFKSYGCVACHQGKNVGGNLYQPLGIMGDYFADRGTEITQSDLGRFNVTGLEEDKFVFRVPSLRLAPLTAPYFHDGSAKTLKDAVRIMIKYQLGRTAPERDEKLIIDFIQSLVGEYDGKKLSL